MKKIMMLTLALFALAFVSCGDDDSPLPIANDIVTGSWVPKSAAQPGLIDMTKTIEYIELDANGTYTEHLLDKDGDASKQSCAYAIYDNGTMLMTLDGDMYRKLSYQVAANKTTLTLDGMEFKNMLAN